jgi:hypothetical protein
MDVTHSQGASWSRIVLLGGLVVGTGAISVTNGFASRRVGASNPEFFFVGGWEKVLLIASAAATIALAAGLRRPLPCAKAFVVATIGLGAIAMALGGLQAISEANNYSDIPAGALTITSYTAAFAMAMLLQLGALGIALALAVRKHS